MRRDKWKKKKYGNACDYISPSVLPLVEEQWTKAGLNPDTLLDHRGYWYTPESKFLYFETEFYDMQERIWSDLSWRFMKRFNGGIDPKTGNFFKITDAAGWIADQYIRRYVPYNYFDGNKVINKNLPWILRIPVQETVVNGWGELLTKDVKQLCIRALAKTILIHCEDYVLHEKDNYKSFDHYLQDVYEYNMKYNYYELDYQVPPPPPYMKQTITARNGKKKDVLIPVRKKGNFFILDKNKKCRFSAYWVFLAIFTILRFAFYIAAGSLIGLFFLYVGWNMMAIIVLIISFICNITAMLFYDNQQPYEYWA